MKIETRAVHRGDRKKTGAFTPVTTPIYTAASYVYDQTATLDRVLGREEEGPCYARYDNPTNTALEELITDLEGGAGSLACSSGMMAVHTAITAALMDRKRSILASNALYGATVSLLTKVLEPSGVDVCFVDMCNLPEVERMIGEMQPGCLLLETMSNPVLRVAPIDRIAELSRKAGAALLVDNTFATPLLVRPLELGAHMVIHSATKYLGGHGDVLGGLVTADEAHVPILRTLTRTYGPVLGPFESYLTMRGIKTFPLRMERQCANAREVVRFLTGHPKVERVYFLENQDHPDRETIARLFPKDQFGAILSFDLKGAGKNEMLAFMDRLQMIVRATSLGDVHSMVLYPLIASHRDLAPKQRERMGIRDCLVRVSVGIEAVEDILADLKQALD